MFRSSESACCTGRVLPAVIECRGLAAGALSAAGSNSLPLTLLHDESGPVRIEVPLADRTLFAQVWVAQVGRSRY